MINLNKAAKRIQSDGLFSILYEDIKKEMDKTIAENEHDTEHFEAIKNIFSTSEDFIEEYKRINREIYVSNIDIKELQIANDEHADVKKTKEEINSNIQILKKEEHYFSVPPSEGLQYVWIGSVAVTLIFIIHNIVAMFTQLYSTAGPFVFSSYAFIVIASILYFRNSNKKHQKRYDEFQVLFKKTKSLINEALNKNELSKDELYSD